MNLRDLLDEVAAGITARPARLVLTTLGTVLGIAALVGTLGIAQTASGQVAQHFDAIAATHVTITPRVASGSGLEGEVAVARLPWDAPERMARLNGAEAAVILAPVDVHEAAVRTIDMADPQGATEHALPVMAASSGLLDALHGEVAGRFHDTGHDDRADAVVVLGRRAAERLQLSRLDRQPSIFIGDRPFVVIGILDHLERRTDLLDAVILPVGTARAFYGLDAPSHLFVRTALGAAQLVGRQAPVALEPNRPDGFVVQVPPSPGAVRQRIQSDVNALFLLLGGMALLVGGLGIANVTLLSVMERIGEVGLRRALGATRRHVAVQFLVESMAIGSLGGLVGAAVGVLATVGVALARSWTPLLDLRLAVAAPALGLVIGLVAGTYPAWKASAIEPITALRQDA